jgi:4-oxalomesaconate tautomerase
MTAAGVRCMLMRGGTSKGVYLLADELPTDASARDRVLLQIMGSPDARQIDGLGGAHPLTSKVAVVSRSADAEADVDYLFLQVGVDVPSVSDRQNCGNLLAGVGQFAVERGIAVVDRSATESSLRVRMINTDSIATSTFPVAGGVPVYEGSTAISGVPDAAAAVRLDFEDTAGSTCGALLPTGNLVDVLDVVEGVEGVEITCVDNGMPTVIVRAADVGIVGSETCADLEANATLRVLLESIRIEAGRLMGLGDVVDATIPKMTLVSRPFEGGSICTRTFIPHRCHEAIGVLGAVSVATALLIPGAVGAELVEPGADPALVEIEHPTGVFGARVEVTQNEAGVKVGRSGIIRTARKLMDGVAFPRP